jgi:adenylyltransferase/sulfurtransferase
VLGVLPGVIGTIQATEAIKVVLGIGEPLVGRLLVYDALRMRFRELKLKKDPECPVCGPRPTVRALIDYEQFCGFAPAGATTHAPGAAQVPAAAQASAAAFNDGMVPEIAPLELKARLDRGDDLVLLDVREPHETEICNLDGSVLIPLGDVPRRLAEIDRTRDLVIYCRSGVRSARAVQFLARQGFDRAVNLNGGILRWIDEVDPTQPKY